MQEKGVYLFRLAKYLADLEQVFFDDFFDFCF